MNRYVVIVAGGEGKRMQSGLPKQFIPIGDKPILMHTMTAFSEAFRDIQMVVVLPEKHIRLWKDLCTEFACSLRHSIAVGGDTRFQSVRNGLKLISGDGIIGVHDGVRPFAGRQTIHTAYQTAAEHGAAIPVVLLNDSLRHVSNGEAKPVNRSDFRLVQTPQCFRADVIKEAYLQKEQPHFTDDATVVEAAGHRIVLTEGNYENIKITRSADLAYAEVLTKRRFML